MTETARTPIHLWIVGGLSLLWNAFGGYDYVMTQSANEAYLAMFTPDQRAHFDSFPMWMETSWAVGVWGAVAGSLLLLLRNRHSVKAFSLSLAGLALSTLWQFGLSGVDIVALFGKGVLAMNAAIWIVAVALLYYAWRLGRAGALR